MVFSHVLNTLLGHLFNYVSGFLGMDRNEVKALEKGSHLEKHGEPSNDVTKMDGNRKGSIKEFLSRDSLPEELKLVSPENGREIDTEEVMRVINDDGSKIHCFDNQGRDTLLHRLAENIDEKNIDQSKLFEYLLKKGANINAVNINLETPLHRAATKNKYHTVRYLITQKADANMKNEDGNNCLHLAVHMGCVETVAVLHLFAGDCFDESEMNKQSLTPLQLARQVEYNDNKVSMGKICEILETNPDEYRKTEGHEKYLKRTDEDDVWCSMPQPVFNINASGNATTCVGNFYITDTAMQELLPNNELKQFTGGFPAIMHNNKEDHDCET